MSTALMLVLSLAAGQETSGSAPLRPAEVVAQQVRSVLYAEDDRAALKQLADALPELALSGQADLQATFEAARVASVLSNELSNELSDEVARPIAPVVESTSFALTLLRAINPEFFGTLLAMIAVSVAFWMASGNGRPRLADISTLTGDVMAFAVRHTGVLLRRPRNHKGRIHQARTLASSGLPLSEVARQTGVSRDALSVLLRMNR